MDLGIIRIFVWLIIWQQEKLGMGDDQFIGAVFCAKNYEAAGHWDNDWSDYAVGYIFYLWIDKKTIGGITNRV